MGMTVLPTGFFQLGELVACWAMRNMAATAGEPRRCRRVQHGKRSRRRPSMVRPHGHSVEEAQAASLLARLAPDSGCRLSSPTDCGRGAGAEWASGSMRACGPAAMPGMCSPPRAASGGRRRCGSTSRPHARTASRSFCPGPAAFSRPAARASSRLGTCCGRRTSARALCLSRARANRADRGDPARRSPRHAGCSRAGAAQHGGRRLFNHGRRDGHRR